uniref:Uncharacterized protein n=1 Tax=Arundo donax TaxID=35708 RepID=A0A0A8YUG1_ARUDO
MLHPHQEQACSSPSSYSLLSANKERHKVKEENNWLLNKLKDCIFLKPSG